jgi:hypothetical protein
VCYETPTTLAWNTQWATLEPDGLGVGWSNPILVDQMGRSGEVVSLEVRGDPADATTGVATLMLFEHNGHRHADAL